MAQRTRRLRSQGPEPSGALDTAQRAPKHVRRRGMLRDAAGGLVDSSLLGPPASVLAQQLHQLVPTIVRRRSAVAPSAIPCQKDAQALASAFACASRDRSSRAVSCCDRPGNSPSRTRSSCNMRATTGRCGSTPNIAKFGDTSACLPRRSARSSSTRFASRSNTSTTKGYVSVSSERRARAVRETFEANRGSRGQLLEPERRSR